MFDIRSDVHPEELFFDAGPARLSGRLYRPATPPVAAVVLNGATGVEQGYYRHFAAWLAAERRIACLTFDYRDFGASRSGPLRQSRVRMSDWALTDMPAARDAMRRLCPGVPLWVIGHSLGGMLMPSQAGIEDIERLICVCSGRAHHSDHPWPYQAVARLFWFGHAPLLTRVLGYLPGRLSGFGADLPARVYWQWRRWCTSPDFYYTDIGWEIPPPNWRRSGAPVDLIALTDDELIPPKSVARLAELYDGNARHRILDPRDFGLKHVGHLGAFSRRNAAMWPALLEGPERT